VSLLGIRVLGDPILRQDTRPVDTITDELRQLVNDMFETMHAADGIGLAAPQVGRTERLAVVEVDDTRVVLINPEITERSAETDKREEGCLSIPEIYGDVVRPSAVTVRALDIDGQPFELRAEGMLARCIQHEIDHLDGKLFLDYLSVLKRKLALSRWAREKDQYPGARRELSAAEVRRHSRGDEEL
jgi:peptide deformylase